MLDPMAEDECSLQDFLLHHLQKLSDILDENDIWKDVVCECPEDWYRNVDVKKFENEQRCGSSPSRAFLLDLCSKAVTLRQLAELLNKVKLERALMIMCAHEPPEILIHPPEKIILQERVHDALEITFESNGFPYPHYEWFKIIQNGKSEFLQEQQVPMLKLFPVTEELEGAYFCRVFNDDENGDVFEVFTSPTQVIVYPDPIAKQIPKMKPPQILRHPIAPPTVPSGGSIKLDIIVEGAEPLKFQWYCDDISLEGETLSQLSLDHIAPQTNDKINDKTSWKYQCRVSNDFGDVLSQNVIVKLDCTLPASQFEAEDKVALLIGNDKYEHMNPLPKAHNDVRKLAQIFTSLKFKVIALYNLTCKEMKAVIHNFCVNFLDKGVYGIFYFVGHGYEQNHHCYMLPVDALEKHSVNDSVCVTNVYEKMQNMKPSLCCILLDMCRQNLKQDEEKMEMKFNTPEAQANTLIFYATSPKSSAYESHEFSNGFFVTHLSKFLHLDIPAEQIFQRVRTSFMADERVATKQIPLVETNVGFELRFTDIIAPKKKSSVISHTFSEIFQNHSSEVRRKLNHPNVLDVSVNFLWPVGFVENIITTVNVVRYKEEIPAIPFIVRLECTDQRVLCENLYSMKTDKMKEHKSLTNISNIQKISSPLTFELIVLLENNQKAVFNFKLPIGLSTLFIPSAEESAEIVDKTSKSNV